MKVVRTKKKVVLGRKLLPKGTVLSVTSQTAQKWINDGIANEEPQNYKSIKRKDDKRSQNTGRTNVSQKGKKQAKSGTDKPKNG